MKRLRAQPLIHIGLVHLDQQLRKAVDARLRELRALLRAKGKPTGGIKADLIKRLENGDESDGEATAGS